MDTSHHRRPRRTAHRPPLPSGPITSRAAEDLGWTPGAQQHAVRIGDLRRPQRGVIQWVDAVPPAAPAHVVAEAECLNRARAAALQCRRAVISHLAGAVAHGMPTYGSLDRSCLTVPAGTALRRLARVHLHRATLTEADIQLLGGDRVTGPARTVFDIAREFGVESAVVAGDFALHAGLVTEAALGEAFELCRSWPGRKAARIALLSMDAAAESPLESLSRLRLASAGLPAPTLQQEICDLDGRFLGRSDFYWDEYGVFGEVDGAMKYAADPIGVRAAERARHGGLEETGLVGVRWGWPDLYHFDRVVARLEIAFKRGARPGAPDRRWGLVAPCLHP